MKEEWMMDSVLHVTGVMWCIVHVRTWWSTHLLFDTAVLACIGSVYLAYILAFVLRDVCVVCVSTYAVNFYLLYASYQRYQHA